jgi:hypothetical protein
MSQYQRDFFGGERSKLESTRSENTTLTAIFTIVVGVLYILISFL